MYRRLGMRGGESETAMKSAGTTGYYQDSSRGSARASEPAGGRDRAGRKEWRMTEVGSWWGWQGRRQRKLLFGVIDERWRGVRGRDWRRRAGRQNVGKIQAFPHLLLNVPTAPSVTDLSHPSSMRSMPNLHSSNVESLDWVPVVFFTYLFHYCLFWWFRRSQAVPCLTPHSCRVAATLLIHSRRNYLERFAVSLQD